MTKAKELATNVIIQMEEIQRQVMNNNSLSGFTNDWQSGFNHAMTELRSRLNDAVLSEPDEQDGLKGWIETVDGKGLRTLLSVASGSYMREMGIEDGESCRAIFHSNRGIVCFTESYDEIKQKIKEAS